jgi:tellurite resistance protein
MEYEMTEERKAKMMEALKDSQEMATSKQLWVINTLCLEQQKEYALPLGKYEACLIINELKMVKAELV